MKKLIGIAAVVLMMTSGVFAKNPGLELHVKEKEVLVVELKDVQNGSSLSLKDNNGEVLFRNNLKDGTYETALDFEVIPVGTYFLTFENDQYLKKTAIQKTGTGLKVQGRPEVVFKPTYKVEGDKVVVFLTNVQENDTYIKVFDAAGNLVGKTKDKKYIFAKTFDFSAMPAGEYRISLKTGEYFFEHKVNIG